MGQLLYNVFALAVFQFGCGHDLPLSVFSSGIDSLLEVSALKQLEQNCNYQLSILATPKEVLDYLETYDEGEKQREMAEAYLILFKLNQLILPSVYIILFALSIILVKCTMSYNGCHPSLYQYCTIKKNKRYFLVRE